MGKITKIMLGLNIVAGIAGIVFGMGVKGDLKEAETAKSDAVANAQQATQETQGLKDANAKFKSELEEAGASVMDISNRLTEAQSGAQALNASAETAQAELQKSQESQARLQSQLAEFEAIGAQVNLLRAEVADYKKLGSLEEFRKLKKDAENRAKKGASNGGPKKEEKIDNDASKGATAKVGEIAVYDKKFGFFIINKGQNNGVKVGDEFNVLRAGNLVGKIKIQSTQQQTSVAGVIRELTRQQLQVGDKVVKSK